MADEVNMAITTAQVLHMVIFHIIYIRYGAWGGVVVKALCY